MAASRKSDPSPLLHQVWSFYAFIIHSEPSRVSQEIRTTLALTPPLHPPITPPPPEVCQAPNCNHSKLHPPKEEGGGGHMVLVV